MGLAGFEFELLGHGDDAAVDSYSPEPLPNEVGPLLAKGPPPAADDWSEDGQGPPRVAHCQALGEGASGLAGDAATARRAVWLADHGEENAEVVVDLGGRPHRRAGVAGHGSLLDGHGRREPRYGVDVGLGQLVEELPGMGGERLHVSALSLGVEGVEGQARLARARWSRNDGQPSPWDVAVDILQVVDAGTANGDEGGLVCGHGHQGKSFSVAAWGICAGGWVVLA